MPRFYLATVEDLQVLPKFSPQLRDKSGHEKQDFWIDSVMITTDMFEIEHASVGLAHARPTKK